MHLGLKKISSVSAVITLIVSLSGCSSLNRSPRCRNGDLGRWESEVESATIQRDCARADRAYAEFIRCAPPRIKERNLGLFKDERCVVVDFEAGKYHSVRFRHNQILRLNPRYTLPSYVAEGIARRPYSQPEIEPTPESWPTTRERRATPTAFPTAAAAEQPEYATPTTPSVLIEPATPTTTPSATATATVTQPAEDPSQAAEREIALECAGKDGDLPPAAPVPRTGIDAPTIVFFNDSEYSVRLRQAQIERGAGVAIPRGGTARLGVPRGPQLVSIRILGTAGKLFCSLINFETNTEYRMRFSYE